MKNRLYETMTHTDIGPYKVRVWRKVETFAMGPDAAVLEKKTQLLQNVSVISPQSIVAAIEELSGIEAVEVLVGQNGGIVYPDWK